MIFDSLLNENIDNFKYKNIKRTGFEIDWFSHVNGRTLLSGTVKYETVKNFKCPGALQSYLDNNEFNIPATILLVDEKEHSIDDFETVENFFIRKENELKDDYLCFGFIKNKKRGFRISRKKQFILNAYSCISKVHNQYGFTKNLQIACTFANKMK